MEVARHLNPKLSHSKLHENLIKNYHAIIPGVVRGVGSGLPVHVGAGEQFVGD